VQHIKTASLSSLQPSFLHWHRRFLLGACSVLGVVFVTQARAAVIGTNVPAHPVAAERIATLPARQQPAWKQYLDRSERQLRVDQAFLQAELREHGLKEPTVPPAGSSVRSIPLNNPPAWYGQAEGRRIADILVSFQTPAGGWSKNLDMSQHLRAPGERFAIGNGSLLLGPLDYDLPHDINWNYVGTFDNDATITQMRFLAKVSAATPTGGSAPYQAAFLRGLDYIFASQYPNGGWPQVWPLQGGYHDTITYNDDAMINVLGLLRDVADGKGEFSFVPLQSRALAAASLGRGVQCMLATQIRVQGHPTVWCQQHDALTLEPASARNYEMPSQTSSESAKIMLFLMELPNPDRAIAASIRAAAAWFEKTEIRDMAVRMSPTDGRQLVAAPGSSPLWARYYQIGTDRPIFGDRDKTIHDTLTEISVERRRGYAWYRGDAVQALAAYAVWNRQHPSAAPLYPPKH
jgi:PelA/Pel-15E family pectate lyase